MTIVNDPFALRGPTVLNNPTEEIDTILSVELVIHSNDDESLIADSISIECEDIQVSRSDAFRDAEDTIVDDVVQSRGIRRIYRTEHPDPDENGAATRIVIDAGTVHYHPSNDADDRVEWNIRELAAKVDQSRLPGQHA